MRACTRGEGPDRGMGWKEAGTRKENFQVPLPPLPLTWVALGLSLTRLHLCFFIWKRGQPYLPHRCFEDPRLGVCRGPYEERCGGRSI